MEAIIDYLGYLPKINLKLEKLGMVIKYYRLKYNLSLEDFCQMTNINTDVMLQVETLRYYKPSESLIKTIYSIVKSEPKTSFLTEVI